MTIGTNPRKNIKRMVEAYHLSKSGKNLKFVIIGEKPGVDLVNERGVRFLGRVPDADMAALLTGSKALVYASLYEGLGIPVLDAMNCEVPVVTSKISSLPEAGGNAAILVDPHNTNSIADGIEEVLSKPKTLIAKGSKHVAKFSWEQTAAQTLAIYKTINSGI
jgi:alpha-1,3-rhamnosyl/mannosyltransferase